MADINVNALTELTTVPESTTYIPVANKSTNAGNVITVENLKSQIVDPGLGLNAHNRFRGKSLGTSFTSTQSANIKNGSFEDIYVGDYWTINGVVYRVAGIDLAYNCGDTSLTTHHVVVVPDSQMYSHKMNETNTTEGGYTTAYGRTTGLVTATETFISAFGDAHVLSYRDILSNAVSNGKSSGWAWTDCRVELMSEMFVYGAPIWGNMYDVGIFCFQAPLFAQAPALIHRRQDLWLRSVASAAYFADVYLSGVAHGGNASNANGIRPLALIS